MIKVSAPEVLIASSCVLFCVGQVPAGIVFASLGVLGACIRTIIENSVRLEQAKLEKETYGEMRQVGNAVAESLSRFTAAMSQRHYDDSEFN